MNPPKCPIHKVDMVLRTAKKGKYTGNKFWGCPTWHQTQCKEMFQYAEDENGESNNKNATKLNSNKNEIELKDFPTSKPTPEVENGESNENILSEQSIQSILPRFLIARSRFKGFQVRFFESIAVPESILKYIKDSAISERILQAFTQWRVDFPFSEELPTWTERERQVFSVAEKILTRGRLTLCSPEIEKEYKDKFLGKNKLSEYPELIDNVLFNITPKEKLEYWLDSPAETKFFQEYIQNILGPNSNHWIIPQVNIASLLLPGKSNLPTWRVDFLICHPLLDPIVVEIDGLAHHDKVIDEKRDAVLTNNGYTVVRIPSDEIEKLEGKKLSTLQDLLSNKIDKSNKTSSQSESLIQFIHSTMFSHQIQLVILQAMQAGFLKIADTSSWKISSDLESLKIFNESESIFILISAINDLIVILRNLGELYKVSLCKGKPIIQSQSDNSSIHLSFSGKSSKSPKTFFIQNISLPFHIANSVFTANPTKIKNPSPSVMKYFLKYIFRKPSFLEGQIEAIIRTLQGNDSIVLLPTGSGKSIVFQLASMLLPGRTIVIAPTIPLMDDQIDNLDSYGIDRAIAITSQIDNPQERKSVLFLFGQGEYLLAYISPQRFQTVSFRKSLQALTVHTPISLIAIDEAHCVSEWGHTFMTAYLNIGRTSRIYCKSNDITPPLLALTGTASRAVLKDIQRELQIEEYESIITPKTFDREELIFHTIPSHSKEKCDKLLGYIGQVLPNLFSITAASFFQPNGKSTFSGLVFCPHTNGDFGVVEISDKIKSALRIPTFYYCGNAPKFVSKIKWGHNKKKIARDFKNNKFPLLVCTKAFGMGIDKPNIRYTIHYGIPPSIESFYQEAGRAGRDGDTAHCCVLVSADDPDRSKKLLNPNTKAEEIHKELNPSTLPWDKNDDITRALYFQTISFPGIADEKELANRVLRAFSDIASRQTVKIIVENLELAQIEKSLHRLLLLNIITDYTINFNSNEFTVAVSGSTKDSIIKAYGKYVEGYLAGRRQVEVEKALTKKSLPYNEFILEMVDLLLHFIYDVIEKGRRRALHEMLLAATESTSDSQIRRRILDYLQATEYSEAMDQILGEDNAGIGKTQEVFNAVRSQNEASEMRGQVSRYLESYPDHPSLLMIRSLAEMFCKDKNQEIAKQNFLASITSAEENYKVTGSSFLQFIIWAIKKISERDIDLALSLQKITLAKYQDENFARSFIQQSSIELSTIPAWFLLNNLNEKSKKIIIE